MAGKQSALRREVNSEAKARPSLDTVTGRLPEPDALELDRLIHERVRLGIVSSLAVNGSLSFTDLRDLLGITDGNLSAHARRLEQAGYVVCTKLYEGRTQKTEYGLTPRGRTELNAYLDHMEAIIQATRPEGGPSTS
ncbi:MAG: transcriptional regulator [Gemmatimonadetes bacterium]|nr:transcriptional regulator [Gemmatimonadota bacterium]MDA1102122.1 transcriptional regulator [Gemmatimonadota bacterium]